MNVAGIDWDDGNRGKGLKHGVSIAEIEGVFSSEPFVSPDVTHSGLETRFIAVGTPVSGRYVFVAFAFRLMAGARVIRPISARHMHRKEIDRLEQATAASDQRR